MISTYETQLADADLAAVLASPGGIEHLISVTGEIPNWLVEFYDQRLGLKQSVPTPRSRAKDCNSWIKKNNRFTSGIRNRRIEIKHSRGMARPTTQAQYQRHSIHLMSRVLDLRTNASPFTVILDDLNQRAQPFVHELTRRGLSRNVNVVFIAFETAGNVHPSVRHIPAWGDHTGDEILQELARAMDDFKESLVIVDSLYDLLSVKGVDMGALFNLVSGKYASTLIGVYHTDITAAQYPENAYAPQSLDIIKYMATTVITCKSFAHVLAIKAAKERSIAEPTHGLLQGAEGIVQCLNANDHRGVVLEAEFRRKSGRPESETFFLRTARRSDYNEATAGMPFGTLKKEFLVLLDQVPAYNSAEVTLLVNAAAEDIESTFNLGLTDKQKEAREGVVLPYFDAQKGEGGEGGRILYDMGEEDDFDEEEDEI